MSRQSVRNDRSSQLSFWALSAFLVILWIAGGASRADAAGQPVVRLSAWIILLGYVLAVPRFELRKICMPLVFAGVMVLLVAIQLIPLPPDIWTLLPGREMIASSGLATGEVQPWRPLSVSPSATMNALGSLIVPILVLILSAALTGKQHWRIVSLLLGLMVAGSLIGLLQFSGARFDHPLVNDIAGMVSANFANRNHFALFLATGCSLAMVWALEGQDVWWKIFVGLGILLFFALMVLATGSRAGVVLVPIALALGLFIVWRRAKSEFSRIPRKVAIAFGLTVVVALLGAVMLSVSFDRAASIDRVLVLEAGDDQRVKGAPIVVDMIGLYFPAGTGFGTFDPAFRISEPDSLLGPRYFNHAHNDWLEVILDGGLLAALLLVTMLIWYFKLSYAAWSRSPGLGSRIRQLGSVVILLIMVASIVDYPARTPMIMALVALSSVWLCRDDIGFEEKGYRKGM